MFESKADLLRLAPEDEVTIVNMGQWENKKTDPNGNIDLLTMIFPKDPVKYAIVLSGEDAVKLFRRYGHAEQKLAFRKIKMKALLPLLMTSQLTILADPFGEELIKVSPAEMCQYCQIHEEEMFEGNLNNLSYLNFRVARARAQGGAIRQKLLEELVQQDIFYVATSSIQPISPFVSTISRLDMRPHVMVFSSADVAKRFCDHVHSDTKHPVFPVRVKTEVLLLLIERNRDVGVDMFYLNDGAEGMAFSYQELAAASRQNG